MPSPSAEPVKEAIDFEFFKQALTLGSAGIAGLAAILTDETKIPGTPLRKILVGGSGILFLVTITAAVWGVSVYANLLTRLQNENGAAPSAGAKRTSATARESMVTHARAVFVTLFLTAVSLLAYAIVLISAPSVERPKDAALLTMIANAQKSADEVLIMANKNGVTLAGLSTEQETRLDALKELTRKSAEQNQKQLGDLDRRLATVELMLQKPGPLTRDQAIRIQCALKARGFPLGECDGIFGGENNRRYSCLSSAATGPSSDHGHSKR